MIPKYFKREKPAVKIFSDGREVCVTKTPAGKKEYRIRTMLMYERQGGLCAICRRPMDWLDMTFEHEAGRGHGGGHRDDRIFNEDGSWKNAAAHSLCNGLKSSRRFHWIDGLYMPLS